MDYSQITIMKMAQAKMAWLSERQDRISQNIVNVDTPGYAPQDLPPLDFSKELESQQRLQMVRTSPEHVQGTPIAAPAFNSGEEKDFFERKPTDNKVNVEEEMRKMDSTAFAYNMTTDLYNKTVKMFKIAIGTK